MLTAHQEMEIKLYWSLPKDGGDLSIRLQIDPNLTESRKTQALEFLDYIDKCGEAWIGVRK